MTLAASHVKCLLNRYTRAGPRIPSLIPATARALDWLGAGKADAYDAALATLREDTRHWWGAPHDPDELEEDLGPTRPMGLACFSNFKDS